MLFFGVINLIVYINRARIQYSVKEVNCSPAAISERNAKSGGSSKACIIILNATNLKNSAQHVDYDGVGGGPTGSWDPLIRIYTVGGKFCYASVMGKGSNFAPGATNELSLGCFGTPGGDLKDPKNIDHDANANPISIEIASQPKTTLVLHPKY